MAQSNTKYNGKSLLYQGVYEVTTGSGKTKFKYEVVIKGDRTTGFKDTERAAAVAYDMVLINNNMAPVNVLKKK